MSELTKPVQAGQNSRPRVVIIGAGFGGLHAARALHHLPADITVVDRKNHHTFQPLLYQVALAVLSPADIAQPIRSILRHQSNTEVLMDEVTAIDVQSRSVILASGTQLPYDYLVLATGSTHSYFGKNEWAPFAPGLKTVEDAIEIRRRVLLAFELAERQMQEHGWHPPLNFVVIGGGPTGVELAGAISDIAKLYMRHDFRHIDPTKSTGDAARQRGPCSGRLSSRPISAKAERILFHLGVEVHTKTHVTNVGPGWIEANNQHIDAAVVLWAAGVQASPLGKMLGAPTDKRGCVIVDDNLNPAGLPEIFVIGDLAHFEQDGHQVPGVAQPAMQMGDHIRKMISADLARQKRPAFRYFDKGDMATIGRMAAVAKVEWPFHAHLSGFPAWVTWIVVHIFFLIGFRQPHRRHVAVDVDLLHIHPRRPTHHWRPTPSRLARPAQRRPRPRRRRPYDRTSAVKSNPPATSF